MVKAYHIAQLRHLYRQMLQPGWTDAKVSEAARGLLGPVIKEIETVFRDGDEEPHVTAADFATLEDQKTRMQAIIERHDARMQALGFARKEKREREIEKETDIHPTNGLWPRTTATQTVKTATAWRVRHRVPCVHPMASVRLKPNGYSSVCSRVGGVLLERLPRPDARPRQIHRERGTPVVSHDCGYTRRATHDCDPYRDEAVLVPSGCQHASLRPRYIQHSRSSYRCWCHRVRPRHFRETHETHSRRLAGDAVVKHKSLRVLCAQEYSGVDTMYIVPCTRCSSGWEFADNRCGAYMGVEHLPLVDASDVPECPIADRCQHQIQNTGPCPVRARGLVCKSALNYIGIDGANSPIGFNAQVCG